MLLFERGKAPGRIYVSGREDSAVARAAEALCAGIAQVCGVLPEVTHTWTEDVRVAVGTYGVSEALPAQAPAALLDGNGARRWEGLCQEARDGRLYLCGCDRRGTAYAAYRFAEEIGVSPWHDLADVPARQRDTIAVADDLFRVDWPSVKWRGIFLNDEEELDEWARRHTGDTTIGPETYEKIFDLILRLGGNLIWPAMHVNAFNMDPENGRLASEMGIVTGTSHCDMLHRSNQNEWQPWVAKKGYDGQKYDYSIPGENRERLLEYWQESLDQNKDYEAIYTIGMRGIHDSGLMAERIAEGEDPMAAQRDLMEEIMAAQRRMIADTVGAHVPQTFVPYKEVLPIYDSGLRVPEDVTLVWVDDNHGHVRRYPSAAEQKRRGGHGLYYHSSYWAPPGMSWLFVCSVPLSHMGNELRKCHEQGIRALWVDNVGALKAIEQDTEYFLRYAWDAGREDALVMDAKAWTAAWVDRNFSGRHGAEVADIYTAWAQLSNLCKPEHMRSHVFSQTAYGDEAAARLMRLAALSRRVDAVWKALPENEQDAFFQLMGMKVKATFYIAASYYFADRSADAFRLGTMRAAEENLRKSRGMDDLKRMLLFWYNKRMSGGRWSGVLTPEAFPPPPLELYPAGMPALKTEPGRLLMRLPDWGTGDALTFVAGERKWFELFNSGSGTIRYAIEADAGIHLSCAAGDLAVETRVFVWVDDGFTQGRIRVMSGAGSFEIPVVRAAQESYLHFLASQAQDMTGWRIVRYMGRGQGDAVEASAEACEAQPAQMRLSFELREACAPEVEIIRFLTLNSVGQIRLRVTLDGGWSQVCASGTTDEWRGDWQNAAVRNGEKLTLALPELRPGRHTLLLEALDPYVTLYAVNVYLRPRVPCVLGPGDMDGCVPIPAFDTAREAALFGLRPEEVPLPDMIYADEAFWTQNMLYARVKRVPQPRYGAPLPGMDEQGTKDLLRCLLTCVPTAHSSHIAIDAMTALCQSSAAWTTPGMSGIAWEHRQAESHARTGVAMYIPAGPAREEMALPGPQLHYCFSCAEPGVYRLWLLMKYDDERHFKCRFLLDGQDVAERAAFCRSHFHTYRTVYVWAWQCLAAFDLTAGAHELAIEAQGTGMAIDRVYLTRGAELPPIDCEWPGDKAE